MLNLLICPKEGDCTLWRAMGYLNEEVLQRTYRIVLILGLFKQVLGTCIGNVQASRFFTLDWKQSEAKVIDSMGIS
jgi:hypothetical protein